MLRDFIKITLKKSTIGRLPKHKAVVLGLGLKKINDFVILEKTDIVFGMIRKINYLINIEVVKDYDVFK